MGEDRPYPLVPLRVPSRRRPVPTSPAAGARAGRRGDALGCLPSLYSSRLGWSSVASGFLPSSPARRAAAPAHGRCAELAGESRFVKPLRQRRHGAGNSQAPFFNKCLGILLMRTSLVLLAGRGGGGEEVEDVWKKMASSYPSGKESMPLEWMSWVLVVAPWWSLSAPSSVRCFFPHKLCFCDSVLVLGCCASRTMLFFLRHVPVAGRCPGRASRRGLLQAPAPPVIQIIRVCLLLLGRPR